MACYEKDCHYVMTHDGDCFYEGFPMDKKENCPMYKAKTNADRIRAMADEELMQFCVDLKTYEGCPNHGLIDCQESCGKCWLEWLKEEAE